MVAAHQNNRGFIDWIIQRVSAILIGLYTIFIVIFLLTHARMDYAVWKNLFSFTVMKVATFVVLIAILWHAWIGLWTVFTDYIKCGALRLGLEVCVIVLLAGYLGWCLFALF